MQDELISRQAVLDRIRESIETYHNQYTTDMLNMWGLFTQFIKEMPSVNPQEKTGHWINHYDEDAKEGWYECDCCHTERAFNTDFCPDCGCRMVEPQERSE